MATATPRQGFTQSSSTRALWRGPAFQPAEVWSGRFFSRVVGGVMGHGPAAFKEADVKRAVKAIAEAIGQLPDSVCFPPDGGFTVMIGKPSDQKSAPINDNEVEDWIAKHVHQS
jgi:hypothetical protein